jgi:hypothetical protein
MTDSEVYYPKVEMCKCGVNQATEPHTCPYAEDINEDYETKCTCCESCEQECAMDI